VALAKVIEPIGPRKRSRSSGFRPTMSPGVGHGREAAQATGTAFCAQQCSVRGGGELLPTRMSSTRAFHSL